MEIIIKHFLHRHELSLSEKKEEDRVDCKGCGNGCVGPTYSCRKSYCQFNLHESCAKLPRELHNPLHPHPLALLLRQPEDEYSRCNACDSIIYDHDGFTFRCDKCQVNLHLDCASIRPAGAIEEREEHFSQHHEHPLLLLENMPSYRHGIYCRLCGMYCSRSDPTYGCLPCGFFLHPSCFERHDLPQEIKHFFHPCPLTLHERTVVDPPNKIVHIFCGACRTFLRRPKFYYGCSPCDFVMDIECALLPTKFTQNETTFYHFLHGHPLSLISNINADEYHNCACCVCGKGCTDDPVTYACGCAKSGYCEGFYLHKSCVELPQQIFHPFHPIPNHPLILHRCGDDERKYCNACSEFTDGSFAYVCECNDCRFRLHIKCSRMKMTAITYEGHDHLLQFNHNIGGINCSACKKYRSTRESYGGFRCLYCYFSLHFSCGPLTYTIQHKSHIHPLVLATSPLEDEEEDYEPDEFYCDACEEQRVDPFVPIYYCKECHFVAEVKCVISEVVSSLNGEYGDVELRNPLGQFGKVVTKDVAKKMMQEKDKQLEPTLTWRNYLDTLSEDEKKEKTLLTDRIKETTYTTEKIEAYDHEEIIMFSDKAYTQFMKFLNHSGFSNDKYFRYPWDLSDDENKEAVVNVGDYMTTRKLALILNHLLSNHGDIGAQSTLSPKFKSLYVCMLCKCIYHMRNTMVVDITHDILRNWWTCLKILQLEGFQIDFAFDHLKRVTHAHFGLYVEKQVDSALHQLDRDIEKLEALKSKRERIKSAKSTKSKIVEECLRDAFVLGKGKAVTSRLL